MKKRKDYTFHVEAYIANESEVMAFAEKIYQMPECKNLTSDEKINIIMAYPIIIQIS